MAVTIRRLRTNANKLNDVVGDFVHFAAQQQQIHLEQKQQRKNLIKLMNKLSNHVDNVVEFSEQKRESSEYNLFVQQQSKNAKKKGKPSGGPDFFRNVSNHWNSQKTQKNNKNVKNGKITRNGTKY